MQSDKKKSSARQHGRKTTELIEEQIALPRDFKSFNEKLVEQTIQQHRQKLEIYKSSQHSNDKEFKNVKRKGQIRNRGNN